MGEPSTCATPGVLVCAQLPDPRCHQPLPDGSTVSQNVNYLRQMAGAQQPYAIPFYTWLRNVWSGGAWDYKTTGLPGMEAMGNFNYGATATVFFGPLTIQSGAGVAQLMFNPGESSGGIPFFTSPYGDAADDVPFVLAGISGGC